MKVKTVLSKTGNLLKENKVTVLQLAVMAAVVGLGSVDALAQTAADSVKGFEAITNPLDKFKDLVTGPVPKVLGTAGIGILGVSTAMSFENQVTKRAIQLMGGVGAGVGATSMISVATDGFIFM